MYPNLKDLEKRLKYHVANTLALSTKRPPEETAEALLSWQRAQDFFDEMQKTLGLIKGKRLLEIGCGYGLFLTICLKNGVKAEAIEPSSQEFYKFTAEIGKEIFKRAGFSKQVVKNGVGEKLPYKSHTFDIVTSFYTLEHVQDVTKVLKEAVRVLKRGGYLYFIIPNYGSFWEGHFGILWIPYLPKWMAKIYVRFWGKNPAPLNEYQLVNQLTLEKQIKRLRLNVIEWGGKSFVEKVSHLSFCGGTLGSSKKFLKILSTIGLLRLFVRLGVILKAQTPIILVAKKY